MGLREELTALRTRLEAGRPAEVLASMHRAVNELRESAAAQRILKVGDRAPAFVLPNATEHLVESNQLLARGNLVVTFYRGRW